MKSTPSTLTAYFDESGIHGDSSHCIVAGFVGSDREWGNFETKWQKASVGVLFHGNEFFGRKPDGGRTKTYKGWSDQKAKDYLTGLVESITSSRLTPVGAVVDVKTFMAFPENERRYLTGAVYIHNRQRFISTGVPGKPYFMALMHCVTAEQNHSFFLADILEYRPQVGGTGSTDDYRWDVEGWYGGDYNRVWFKSEGQRNTAFKADYDIDSQLLFGHFIQQYYDLQIGGRLETQSFRGRNVTRGLAVIGLQGLVPYNYEIQPAIFISQHGDLSARLTATKEFSLTQRLILQPRFETNAAIQRVRKFTTGSGLNNLELGFRLRYEIRREFAPYVGISLDKSFGDTATLVRQEGGNPSQIRFVVGVRLWF